MHADLLVVGGGIVGLATAHAAASRGASVALVDPRPRVNEHNASNDESKVFRFAYAGEPEYALLARDALHRWRALERESGRRLLHETGLLLFEGPFADASEKTLRDLGEPVEAFEAAGVAARWPALRASRAVVDGRGGWLDPRAALAALEEGALARGLRLDRRAAVEAVEESGERVVARLTDGSRVTAGAAVVAAGFHAPRLVPSLAPLIRVTRQVELFFEAPRDLAPFPTFAAFEEGFYGFPPGGGVVKVADHRKGPEVADFESRPPPTPAEVETARAWLRRRIPALADAPLARWRVCLYDNAPDDRFVLGPPPGHRRLHVAAGMSGHAFKFAPALGARLADVALASARGA